MLKILYSSLTTASCKAGKGYIAYPGVHVLQQWRYYSISLRMNWESQATVNSTSDSSHYSSNLPFLFNLKTSNSSQKKNVIKRELSLCLLYSLFSGFTLWFFSFKFRSNLSIPLYLSNTCSRMIEVTLDHQYPT